MKIFDVAVVKLPKKVRAAFPTAKTISDGTRRIAISITAKDRNHATAKDPTSCAMAQACRREQHVDGAWIGMGTSYLLKGTHLIRYLTPSSVSREIVSFDRGHDFAPGDYALSSIYPAIRLGNRTKRPSGKVKDNSKRRRGLVIPRHHTVGVRQSR